METPGCKVRRPEDTPGLLSNMVQNSRSHFKQISCEARDHARQGPRATKLPHAMSSGTRFAQIDEKYGLTSRCSRPSESRFGVPCRVKIFELNFVWKLLFLVSPKVQAGSDQSREKPENLCFQVLKPNFIQRALAELFHFQDIEFRIRLYSNSHGGDGAKHGSIQFSRRPKTVQQF